MADGVEIFLYMQGIKLKKYERSYNVYITIGHNDTTFVIFFGGRLTPLCRGTFRNG